MGDCPNPTATPKHEASQKRVLGPTFSTASARSSSVHDPTPPHPLPKNQSGSVFPRRAPHRPDPPLRHVSVRGHRLSATTMHHAQGHLARHDVIVKSTKPAHVTRAIDHVAKPADMRDCRKSISICAPALAPNGMDRTTITTSARTRISAAPTIAAFKSLRRMTALTARSTVTKVKVAPPGIKASHPRIRTTTVTSPGKPGSGLCIATNLLGDITSGQKASGLTSASGPDPALRRSRGRFRSRWTYIPPRSVSSRRPRRVPSEPGPCPCQCPETWRRRLPHRSW